MSLEQLIESGLKAYDALEAAALASPDGGLTPEVFDPLMQVISDADDKLVDFVYRHANDLIAWERMHAARALFDDYEIST